MDVQSSVFFQRRKVVSLTWLGWLVLPGAVFFLTSCTTPAPKVTKFKEAAAADFVARYASDQTIYRLKPDAYEGKFYHIFTRQELCEADARRQGARNLAVVLIGYYWTPELDAQARQGWIDALARLNYRRVVILRASDSDQVDGLSVLDDRLVGQVTAAVKVVPPGAAMVQ